MVWERVHALLRRTSRAAASAGTLCARQRQFSALTPPTWKVAAEAFAPALPAAQGSSCTPRFYRRSACLPLRMGGGGVSGEGAGTQSFANIRQTRESGPVQPGEAGARTTRYSFAEARKYARSFGFQTEEEYREYKCAGAYSKALLPADPASVFADDWYLHQWSSSVFSASPTLWPQTLTLMHGRTDWGDWLGSMLPFEEARLRVRALDIASEDEWKQMVCGVWCVRACACVHACAVMQLECACIRHLRKSAPAWMCSMYAKMRASAPSVHTRRRHVIVRAYASSQAVSCTRRWPKAHTNSTDGCPPSPICTLNTKPNGRAGRIFWGVNRLTSWCWFCCTVLQRYRYREALQ